MAHRFTVAGLVILLFAAAGAAFVFLSGDDDQSDTAQGTTTTVATSASTTRSTAASTTTTAPPPTGSTQVPEACGVEGGPIAAAVDNGVTNARDRAQVDQCRFAASDPSWVAVRLVAKQGANFDATTVLLHGGAGSWSVVGSGDAACSEAPQAVRVDLGLICSSGGGV